nr:MAG TPA: hypothetical protein [Caudoviricetes sp.]
MFPNLFYFLIMMCLYLNIVFYYRLKVYQKTTQF